MEETCSEIHGCIITAQIRVASAFNTAMVLADHEIGEQVYKACGENARAEYGQQLLQYLSQRLTAEFGKGFNIRNLQMMRKFYVLFSNANALCSELGWSHYRLLLRVSAQAERQFYMEECFSPSIRKADLRHVLSTSAIYIRIQEGYQRSLLGFSRHINRIRRCSYETNY